MGLCLSKKKVPTLPSPPPNDPPKEKAKPTPSAVAAPKAAEEPAAEKRPVFVITHKRQSITEAEEEKKKEQVIPSRKSTQQEEGRASNAAEEIRTVAPVRTSSCTKEEVDAILIQCGRLSRSSSGKANENNGAASCHRRYSGSKRSYDFDNERRAEEDELEKGTLRPSPNRRRATSRERGDDTSQRSGSRERASGSGGRRVSRSPGRRSDAPASSASTAGDKPKQPGKMVPVPARDKGGATAVVDASGSGVKKVAPAGGNRKAAASPRSRSPANSHPQPQSLSRSSSRKAEHSPYRRNPMTEIDDNTLNANKINSSSNASKMQKPSPSQSQKTTNETNPQTSNETKATNSISNCVREQLMSCRTKEQKLAEPGKPESLSRKPRSRRTSRDFDQTVGLTPNSYNSVILEDIHHYHQQNNTTTAFSLPACVTKACSILEAVADLNSDNRSYDGDGGSSENGRFGRQSKLMPFVESELVVKDDLMEPSLHKYVTVRGEVEPQESAGSNSFAGQPWGSPWGPNSVDSTDRYEEEVDEEVIEEDRDLDDWGRRLRVSGTETAKKKEFDRGQHHRSSGSGGRALSVSGAAAGSS